MSSWPNWLQTEIHNATTPDRQRAAKFAMSAFDHLLSSSKSSRGNPQDAALWAAAQKYSSYVTPNGDINHPTSFVNRPDDPFWVSTPERRADRDLFLNTPQTITVTTTADLNPLHIAARAVSAVEKIPVIGDAVKIVGEASAAPFKVVANIASGERLDHVALGAFKDQLKIVKDVAPYAATVVSFIPGIGTGVAAAISAGAALAEGQSLSQVAEAAIRGAIPGGPLAVAAFDTATKVAGGESLSQAALESARGLLPPGPAQSAFDVGVAVATGKKLQTALANGLLNLAPGELQTVISTGEKAITSTPGLSTALASVAPGAATEGFNLAAGLLSHAGINEKSLTDVRSRLPADVVKGFDAALKTQIPHTAWLANVTSAPVAPTVPGAPVAATPKLIDPPAKKIAVAPQAPKMTDPPAKKVAAAPKLLDPPTKSIVGPAAAPAYAPYPKTGTAGTLSGPVDSDAVWGPAFTDMDGGMQWAGRSAVHGSKGHPRAVQGPDGVDYLFEIQNGTLTARRRVA